MLWFDTIADAITHHDHREDYFSHFESHMHNQAGSCYRKGTSLCKSYIINPLKLSECAYIEQYTYWNTKNDFTY